MRLTVKTKIWMTVITIVLLFAFFVLFYLPAVQERYILSNFNKEVQNYTNTVALGVKIAMTEQNFEGVKTAIDFVKKDPQIEFVSLLQIDTIWAPNHSAFQLKKSIFKTYPDNKKVDINAISSPYLVVKRAHFVTPLMTGEILLASSTNAIIQSRKQIRATSLFFSFVVFAIGILIGFGLARNISVPVLELRDAANRVGEGDLTQRVKNKSNDEIGELGIAFNKMVDDLARARREIDERTNELVLEKKKTDELLIDLQHTLANLKEAQEQLIRQEKMASIGQLTKGLVDRILNPLNYINNFSLISKDLLNEINSSVEQEKYANDTTIQEDVIPLLEMAQRNVSKTIEHGSNLSRIVRSMEKLLKVKSDNFVFTNISSLIENHLAIALEEARQEYDGFAIQIITEFDSQDQHVKILPAEMGSVIVHIISNAIFSLHEKSIIHPDYIPKITIKTRLLNETVEIKIRDNGKGIPDSEVKQLFTPFTTTKPTAKGTGLGLYMSQDIVKTHKGSIVIDTQEGEYTELTISLPI